MSGNKARLGAGNIEMELDGETVTLRPTLNAAQTLSRRNGGLLEVINQVGRFDLDVMVQVVTLGLGLTGSEAERAAERVWKTGVINLAGPLTRYVHVLVNGGRAPGAKEDRDDRDPPKD